MILRIESKPLYRREMIGAVPAWRAKQRPQERIRWDQIWDYFQAAEDRQAPGTVLPNGQIVLDVDVVYAPGRYPLWGDTLKVPKA